MNNKFVFLNNCARNLSAFLSHAATKMFFILATLLYFEMSRDYSYDTPSHVPPLGRPISAIARNSLPGPIHFLNTPSRIRVASTSSPPGCTCASFFFFPILFPLVPSVRCVTMYKSVSEVEGFLFRELFLPYKFEHSILNLFSLSLSSLAILL